MCRLPVSASCAATLPPLERPPTNASAPISGERISASESSEPSPDSSVTGRPSRAMSAWATVSVIQPPWVGVFATTPLPASSCTSSACTCTLIG